MSSSRGSSPTASCARAGEDRGGEAFAPRETAFLPNDLTRNALIVSIKAKLSSHIAIRGAHSKIPFASSPSRTAVPRHRPLGGRVTRLCRRNPLLFALGKGVHITQLYGSNVPVRLSSQVEIQRPQVLQRCLVIAAPPFHRTKRCTTPSRAPLIVGQDPTRRQQDPPKARELCSSWC